MEMGIISKMRGQKKLSVKPEEIIIGNSSNELLDIAVRTFLAPGDEAVMAHLLSLFTPWLFRQRSGTGNSRAAQGLQA